jgi:hypothetical protein
MFYAQNIYNQIISPNLLFKHVIIRFTFLLDFYVQSSAVADAAYSVQWYNHSTKFKKMLQMIIIRAQRPCIIYLGPIFPLTMENFYNVSQISLFN